MSDDELRDIEARFSASDIPALVAEIRRLRAEVAELNRCLAVTGDPRNPFGDSPGEEAE